jgi:hypothetical protein
MIISRKQQMLESALDAQCTKLVEVYCSNVASMGRQRAFDAAQQGISNLLSAEIAFKTLLELE